MSEKTPRIEAQYLQAAAAQATSYYQAIWQKMGYVLAIQYGSIAAAYVLRGTYWSAMAIAVPFVFSWGLTWAAEHDIRSREILLAQANYIARGLDLLFAEHPPPAGLRVPFELDPFPATHLPHIVDWLRPILTSIMQYVTWLQIRVAILFVVDFSVAVILTFVLAPHVNP